MITAEQLKAIIPTARPAATDTFLPHLNLYMPVYEINTVHRIAAFLANLAHESGSLRYMREIWGPTKQQVRYERNFAHAWPPTAADPVNELAYKLGNYAIGDGKFFCGHGAFQITGRSNHLQVSERMFGDDRLIKNPEIITTPQYGIQSACDYWMYRSLNQIADEPETKVHEIIRHGRPTLHISPFDFICYKINGGFNGIEERREFYKRAIEVLAP